MFATRLNKQLPTYASWLSDPGSKHIDAMTISWNNVFPYIFSPFSMLWPVLKKITNQSEKATVIAPMWPTQTWFTTLLQLAIQEPLIINSRHLIMSGTSKKHPLSPKMKLLAVLCSNNIAEQNNFRQKLTEYYQQRGGKEPVKNIQGSSKDSPSFVIKNKWIPCKQI